MHNEETKRMAALNRTDHPPTCMVMAGGTGGHVFPGLAVAHQLTAQGWRVVWMGAPAGMEADLVPKHGFEMVWVRFSGLRGKGLMAKLLLPMNLLVAFWQALGILRREKPAFVLGMGGYIAFPGGMMAALLGIPLLLHEQNAIAGLTNKVLAGVADHRMSAFPGALKDAQTVGNPVRAEIAALPAPAQRFAGRTGPLQVLVVGGSLGAQALNDIVPQALALMPSDARPSVIHQSGSKHLTQLQDNYAKAGVAAQCVAFIDDMAAAYAQADLVICRAGAMTVMEVAAAGVAALFVPFPHAVDDHQSANAQFLASKGAALMVQQRDLTAQGLAQQLSTLTRQQLLQLAENAHGMGESKSTALVVEACEKLAKRPAGKVAA
jgi:UDP-N-acetylglucosamine--N-acetylmuramyl-(pentapeptide) pyrophosphoryl-undecaprenol N-acetylglucosamine transferase